MKILFLCSGNSTDFDIPPFIKAQADSLEENKVSVDFFKIKGKGFQGYAGQVMRLRRHLKKNSYDLIHAHYSLSGLVVILARPAIPLVLSLMGTDAYGEFKDKDKIYFKSRVLTLLTFMVQPFVDAIISKSDYIASYVYRKKISYVIPNGISLEIFIPMPQKDARKILGLDENKRYVLFLGDMNYKRKNFELAKRAVREIDNSKVELLTPYPVAHEKVVYYLNATDVLIQTAFMEGSSNIIKEAMACNCPVVTTDVGDAKWVLGNTPGCYITSFRVGETAEKIWKAIQFSASNGKTNGRERIKQLGLDAETVASKLMEVYNGVLKSWFHGN